MPPRSGGGGTTRTFTSRYGYLGAQPRGLNSFENTSPDRVAIFWELADLPGSPKSLTLTTKDDILAFLGGKTPGGWAVLSEIKCKNVPDPRRKREETLLTAWKDSSPSASWAALSHDWNSTWTPLPSTSDTASTGTASSPPHLCCWRLKLLHMKQAKRWPDGGQMCWI